MFALLWDGKEILATSEDGIHWRSVGGHEWIDKDVEFSPLPVEDMIERIDG